MSKHPDDRIFATKEFINELSKVQDRYFNKLCRKLDLPKEAEDHLFDYIFNENRPITFGGVSRLDKARRTLGRFVTLNIFTIVLDGAPWIGAQFAELSRLRDFDWHWSIVEGAAMPVKDTAWMGNQQGKVSHDGTNQFVQSLANHPRITVNSKPEWGGKTEMINAALTAFKKDGVLLQMDSDELWTADQLAKLRRMFGHNPEYNTVKVKMDYMLGPNVISTSTDGYGNRSNEWVRAWRYSAGLWMECHEPPVFNGNRGRVCGRDESEAILGPILHMAWVTPQQVAFKQRIYRGGYEGACEQWEALQSNTKWPVKDLKTFLPWVGNGASADLLFKS